MDTLIKPGDLEVLRDLVNSIKVKIQAIEEYLDKKTIEQATEYGN